MKTKLLITVIAFFFLIGLVCAFDLSSVNYPVSELGNCASQQACAEYCDNPVNMMNCIDFAEKNGMMTSQEAKDAKKVLPYMQKGETPGKCKSQNECDSYCENESHLEECINFALKVGLIDSKEAEMVKKTGGKGPGGCKKDECKDYCDKEENFQTCIDFALANGLMTQEDYDMAKKTGGKGPGNCKGKEECDVYCKEHAAECMKWGMENGMMDDKLKSMSEGEKCMMNCIIDNNINPESCGGGKNSSECKPCEDKCFGSYSGQCISKEQLEEKQKACSEDEYAQEIKGSNEEGGECITDIKCVSNTAGSGKCLNEEKWNQLNQDCQAKGSGYHLEDVKGDDGYGGECVIDENCVYSSDSAWESQEEKDRKLAEMQEQWAREKEEYEKAHQGGDDGGNSGGCTQPGPEGQCNPGPGAESSQENQQTPNNQEQVQQQQEQNSQEQPSDSSGSGDVGITGQVISEQGETGLVARILKFLSEIFNKK